MENSKRVIFMSLDKRPVTQQQSYLFVGIFCLVLIIVGLSSATVTSVMAGLIPIMTSPSNLLTDYFVIGGFGSAFFNSGFLTLLSLLLCRYHKIQLNGPVIAALFSVAGFSLFGKNLFNSIPILIGVYLYSYLVKRPYSQYVMISLFGSALSPVISYIAFGIGFPYWQSVPISYLVGILIGLMLPPTSAQALNFHQGFSLYNVGFSSGIIAMFFTGALRLLDYDITTRMIVSNAYNSFLFRFLFILFSGFFAIGFLLNGRSFKGLLAIFHSSGKLVTDFVAVAGVGATVMNMAVMGALMTSYVYLVNGVMNGPIVGAIFFAVGFSAFGNHLLNSLPILLGVFLASQFTPLYDVDHTSTLIAAIAGTSLAPISGYYGKRYGVLAGFLHMALVNNVGFLHGGLNLYNNGFSAGFVAAFLVPLLDNFKFSRRKR